MLVFQRIFINMFSISRIIDYYSLTRHLVTDLKIFLGQVSSYYSSLLN